MSETKQAETRAKRVFADHQKLCLTCRRMSVPSPTNCYEAWILHLLREVK